MLARSAAKVSRLGGGSAPSCHQVPGRWDMGSQTIGCVYVYVHEGVEVRKRGPLQGGVHACQLYPRNKYVQKQI